MCFASSTGILLITVHWSTDVPPVSCMIASEETCRNGPIDEVGGGSIAMAGPG